MRVLLFVVVLFAAWALAQCADEHEKMQRALTKAAYKV